MDTRGAIKFVEEGITSVEILPKDIFSWDIKKKEIVKRLQMWDDFKSENRNIFRNIDGGMAVETLKDMMDNFEKEYLVSK